MLHTKGDEEDSFAVAVAAVVDVAVVESALSETDE
jgi:hypothetical protein